MSKDTTTTATATTTTTTTTTTTLIHGVRAYPARFASPQLPTYKASTVFFDNVAAMRGHDWKARQAYSYGLHGTPASFELEDRIAHLEGAAHCTLYPSGLAAIANVLIALLQTGDEVLIPDNTYGPTLTFAQSELTKYGITHQLYDPMDAADLAAKISANTKLVWLEAPGSVTMDFPPLLALIQAAKAAQVTTVLDNTWGAGLAFAPFDLAASADGVSMGVDVCVHALTKYPSGGGDVLMGSVTTRNQALHHRIQLTRMHMGFGCAGDDVQLVLRNLSSMALRYKAQDAAARQLARYLQTRPEVAQVLHPALDGDKTDPQSHANWLATCGASGLAAGIFSIVFDPKYTQPQVDAFCEALQLFKLGYSWGGATSLVVPYDVADQRQVTKAKWQGAGRLVRLCIGLEDVGDLQRDLSQGLAKMLLPHGSC